MTYTTFLALLLGFVTFVLTFALIHPIESSKHHSRLAIHILYLNICRNVIDRDHIGYGEPALHQVKHVVSMLVRDVNCRR